MSCAQPENITAGANRARPIRARRTETALFEDLNLRDIGKMDLRHAKWPTAGKSIPGELKLEYGAEEARPA